MIKSVKAHPGVFIGGAVTFFLIEHYLMHRGGASKIRQATSKNQ